MTKNQSKNSADKKSGSRPDPDPNPPASATGKGGTRGDLHAVYERLRQNILDGTIRPGEVLNQVHIAKLFNVSRTPVREALRMLQAEGLAEAHFQHRIRVTAVTPEEVDAVYAMWILMDALAISLTVPRLQPAELTRIREALHAMNASSPPRAGAQNNWAELHIAFHRLLTLHAGGNVASAIENCRASSERARRTFMRTAPQSWLASEEEHNGVVEAYAEGSVDKAIYIMSRQLSRIALTVIGNIDPSYEPVAIRQSLKLVGRPSALNFDTLELPSDGKKEPVKSRDKKTRAPSTLSTR